MLILGRQQQVVPHVIPHTLERSARCQGVSAVRLHWWVPPSPIRDRPLSLAHPKAGRHEVRRPRARFGIGFRGWTGETIEAARADFARMLGLTAQVNELVDQLAMAAADPVTSALSKRHLQLALLAEFAERCAGGPVATHQPLRELLAELEGKLRAES